MTSTKHTPDVISPIRPRRKMPALAADPDAWINSGQTPNAPEQPTPTPVPEPAPQPEPEKDTAAQPITDPTAGSGPVSPPPPPALSEPPAPSEEATSGHTAEAAPDKKPKTKVFTLDIPTALHKNMRRKTILAGTNMTADAQRVLDNAYNTGTPPQDIPDYPRLDPSETQRITIALTHDLHTKIKLNTLESGSTMANEIRYHLEREYAGE
ncbi:hypothetical protein [Mycobacterium talmoniae]|uniref:Uncharacterized protein n=1 Tax=Mycobacterium talmoniae TaxID=1858794 RepID=A0A1S1NE04_9MYCO|nr:hypothetical protein [Mycobacterium talmoniae]OHU98201.1 hypothetical protein BKN37_21080 [Mycobacterium talmoniae]